jgi:hypothetical protein
MSNVARTSPSGPPIIIAGGAPVGRTLTTSQGVGVANLGASIPVTRGSYIASAFVPLVGTASGAIKLTFTPTTGAPVVLVNKAYSAGTTQTYAPVLAQLLDIPTAGSLQWAIDNASGTATIANAEASVQPFELTH